MRRYSYVDEEVDVLPSTELIPDEYEHQSNEKVLVHLLTCFEQDPTQEKFVQTLKSIDFNLEKTIIRDETSLETKLKQIKDNCENKDGLIVIFNFLWKEKGKISFKNSSYDVTKIWGQFTTKNCPALKDKPKVFIFALENGDKTDSTSVITKSFDSTYASPSEADILVVYSEGYNTDFLENLSDNITDYGKSEDLLTLVAISDASPRPVCISTMTRKFYTTVNSERGHQVYINESTSEIFAALRSINEKLDDRDSKHGEVKKKEKRKFSFRDLLPGSTKKEEKKSTKQEKIAEVDSPAKHTMKLQSVASSPGPSKKDEKPDTRSRRPSVDTRKMYNSSEFSRKNSVRKSTDSKPKPAWK